MCLMNINMCLIFFINMCLLLVHFIVSKFYLLSYQRRTRVLMFLGTTFFMEYICYDWRYVLILWTSSSWVTVFATIKLDDWRWSGLIMKFNSGKSSATHCNYIDKSIIWKHCVYELWCIYGLAVFAAFIMEFSNSSWWY